MQSRLQQFLRVIGLNDDLPIFPIVPRFDCPAAVDYIRLLRVPEFSELEVLVHSYSAQKLPFLKPCAKNASGEE